MVVPPIATVRAPTAQSPHGTSAPPEKVNSFRFAVPELPADVMPKPVATRPFIVPVEQLFDENWYNEHLSALARNAPPAALKPPPGPADTDRPTAPSRARWLIVLGALVAVCALTRALWFSGSNRAQTVSPPAEAKAAARHVPPRSAADAIEHEPVLQISAQLPEPNVTLRRRSPIGLRQTVPEAPTQPKRRSVLGSVLAPPPN